ncbi:hypothetical protein NCU17247 [Neurospora crassa OR74A]|uniref:CCHC-type domain-containing protein n=1 Tax=Neurospora crassa (strain ATCC 24698 / 74-OR23-1A / CBS 708.71 / DSM 1257 / FGSC 987) TaxID=367110 RepID=V5IMM7_NEUCR|nr:hypothetical protein NCU17247 [Neurospora crassa OR74A]ESA42001.1 hypothetical protein NCU17247 [Neurospora crassa OR74A]|eukprot:XP_011395375.1 hypothetical protein NCU17247 [Neurospora crassa OR74A]
MVALADGVVDKKKFERVRAEEFKTQEGARREGNWTGHGPLRGPGLPGTRTCLPRSLSLGQGTYRGTLSISLRGPLITTILKFCSQSGGQPSGAECYKCGEVGHIARSCSMDGQEFEVAESVLTRPLTDRAGHATVASQHPGQSPASTKEIEKQEAIVS